MVRLSIASHRGPFPVQKGPQHVCSGFPLPSCLVVDLHRMAFLLADICGVLGCVLFFARLHSRVPFFWLLFFPVVLLSFLPLLPAYFSGLYLDRRPFPCLDLSHLVPRRQDWRGLHCSVGSTSRPWVPVYLEFLVRVVPSVSRSAALRHPEACQVWQI